MTGLARKCGKEMPGEFAPHLLVAGLQFLSLEAERQPAELVRMFSVKLQ